MSLQLCNRQMKTVLVLFLGDDGQEEDLAISSAHSSTLPAHMVSKLVIITFLPLSSWACPLTFADHEYVWHLFTCYRSCPGLDRGSGSLLDRLVLFSAWQSISAGKARRVCNFPDRIHRTTQILMLYRSVTMHTDPAGRLCRDCFCWSDIESHLELMLATDTLPEAQISLRLATQ